MGGRRAGDGRAMGDQMLHLWPALTSFYICDQPFSAMSDGLAMGDGPAIGDGLVMGDQLLYLWPAMTSFYICDQP